MPSTGGPALPLDPAGRRLVRPGCHAPPPPRPTSQRGRWARAASGRWQGSPSRRARPPVALLVPAAASGGGGANSSPVPPTPPPEPVWRAPRSPSRLVRSVLRCLSGRALCAYPAVLEPFQLLPVSGGPGLEAGRRAQRPLPNKSQRSPLRRVCLVQCLGRWAEGPRQPCGCRGVG